VRCGIWGCRLFFGVDLVEESDLLSKGKLVCRFLTGFFADLAAGGRALLTEMAIWARILLGPSPTARLVEYSLILG
jgi:hypothetical protein